MKKKVPHSHAFLKHLAEQKAKADTVVVLRDANCFALNEDTGRCPDCSLELQPAINKTVDKNKKAKPKTGLYCSHCNKFFYTGKALDLKVNYSVETKNICGNRPVVNQKAKKLTADTPVVPFVNSTEILNEGYNPISLITVIGVIDVQRNKFARYLIVANSREQNSTREIYYKDREITKTIFSAIAKGKKNYSYQDKSFFILYYKQTPQFEKFLKLYRFCNQILDVQNGAADVIVYRGKPICRDHPDSMECATAMVWCARSSSPAEINVYYCPMCGEFYINQEEYNERAREYGLPFINLVFDFNEEFRFHELREESRLALYGYSVDIKKNMTSGRRHQLLSDLIDMELMKKPEIISHLEFLIRLNKHKIDVCSRWREDIEYVSNYNIDKQRIVWANFIPMKRPGL